MNKYDLMDKMHPHVKFYCDNSSNIEELLSGIQDYINIHSSYDLARFYYLFKHYFRKVLVESISRPDYYKSSIDNINTAIDEFNEKESKYKTELESSGLKFVTISNRYTFEVKFNDFLPKHRYEIDDIELDPSVSLDNLDESIKAKYEEYLKCKKEFYHKLSNIFESYNLPFRVLTGTYKEDIGIKEDNPYIDSYVEKALEAMLANEDITLEQLRNMLYQVGVIDSGIENDESVHEKHNVESELLILINTLYHYTPRKSIELDRLYCIRKYKNDFSDLNQIKYLNNKKLTHELTHHKPGIEL